jgi:pantothenate kinase-related protein Tda10
MIKRNKELIIEIKGKAGSGKTLMALALKRFLQEKGFDDVHVADDDLDSMSLHTQHLIDNFDGIFKDYPKSTTVSIKTAQITRHSFL